MKKLKTAVLGTGFMGRVHTEGIRRVSDVDISYSRSLDSRIRLLASAELGKLYLDMKVANAVNQIKAFQAKSP